MVGLSLDPGELTERVTFRKKLQVADGQGGFTTSWDTHVTVWAKVAPMRGSDRLQAGQIEDRRDYEITIRWRSDITDVMAIRWRGLTFGIRFRADFGGRAQFLRLEVESGLMSEAGADV